MALRSSAMIWCGKRGTEDVAKVGLYWHNANKLTTSYTVFMQLLDQQGVLAWGWDNPPCRRTCPTESWQPGEYIRDEYTLPISTLTVGATYTVATGMYDPGTGQRLPLLADNGKVIGDYMELTTIQP